MNAGLVVVLMALAGGLGAVSRFVMDAVIRARVRGAWPVGTMTINVLGSFVLGVLTAAVMRDGIDPNWRVVLGTGFLGGFTTFSTACVEVVRLVQQGRQRLALLVTLLQVALAVGAAALGFWLAA